MLPIPLVGPLLLLKYAADGHEWAQRFNQEMLPMPLDGPIIATKKCCRWPRMGPVCVHWEMLPIPLNEPVNSKEGCC